ncbi:hypothetical protein [Sphingomonas koreensis]|uniref:hypothetical protein n=1 Tax=Sphingomonas koreensis TaxID=93064 RepID=UPI000F7E6125|nr:hypothetical protein [Sphingomonas koreensis]MDC7808781.1 hypothetical protein [Sphingomonas koreensis]RSU98922.1 hypothetical protein CA256_03055 [Sphingomonas koreensis]
MDPIVAALLNSGPIGIAAAILLWKDGRDRQQMRDERAERLAFDKERLAADKKLASALTALALRITGRIPDGDPS